MDNGLCNLGYAIGMEGYYQEVSKTAPEFPRQMVVVAYAFRVMATAIADGVKKLREAPPQEPAWYSWLSQ